jgi:1-deoxy-D-xylulose-5-phosphate reductoisomerase
MQKSVFILGATGSIGESALRLIRAEPDKFRLSGISAHRSTEKVLSICREFKPDFVHMMDKEYALCVSREYQGTSVIGGMDELLSLLSTHKFNIVLGAMVGMVGLLPAITVLKNDGFLALANKEALVCAGKIVNEVLSEHPAAQLVPVDSEHSAIYQCLRGEDKKTVRRIILTASGGPFRNFSAADMQSVTPAQAMRHPNWNMGPKITVDSATLMNKGLEVIEAHWLFDTPYKQIEVVIHPQSIIHSMVEFHDGSIMCQMGEPDMLLPIQHAFSHPRREKHSLFKPLDFPAIGSLSFAEPDRDKFPCLDLAYYAGERGGIAPAALNATNEIAVSAFLNGKISFNHIAEICRKVLSEVPDIRNPQLDDILQADIEARRKSLELVNKGGEL